MSFNYLIRILPIAILFNYIHPANADISSSHLSLENLLALRSTSPKGVQLIRVKRHAFSSFCCCCSAASCLTHNDFRCCPIRSQSSPCTPKCLNQGLYEFCNHQKCDCCTPIQQQLQLELPQPIPLPFASQLQPIPYLHTQPLQVPLPQPSYVITERLICCSMPPTCIRPPTNYFNEVPICGQPNSPFTTANMPVSPTNFACQDPCALITRRLKRSL